MIYDTGIGLIPFVRKIIDKKKYNEYFLYMDDDVFPIGKRSKEFIINHLNYIINYAKNKFDILILACNSLSSYLKYLDLSKTNLKIYSIFEENTKLIDEDTTFICTSASSRNIAITNVICLDDLPNLIENSNVKEIIKEIGNMEIHTKKAILGCTHFPFIDFIFKDIKKDVVFESAEDVIIDKLPSTNVLSLKGNKKATKYLLNYLKKSNKILC